MNDEKTLAESQPTRKKSRLRVRRSPSLFKETDTGYYSLMPPCESAFSIKLDILIAISPVLAWAVYLYGFRPIVITLICAIMSLGLENAAKTVLKRNSTFDLTPAVTGVIIALGLPPSAPLWLPALAAVFAVIVSQIFGGTGKHVLSPAAVSLAACFLLFPAVMSAIPATGQMLDPFAFTVKGFTNADRGALDIVLSGFLPDMEVGVLFFGMRAGMIGEMSGFLLVAGLIYLCVRGIARPILPIAYLATVGVIAYLEPSLNAASDVVAINGSFYNMLDCNTMLCAIYMASDTVTTPKTTLGTLIAGVAGGAVTVGMRYYLRVDISALAGILAINVLSPLLDLLFRPEAFGGNLKADNEKNKTEAKNEELSESA